MDSESCHEISRLSTAENNAETAPTSVEKIGQSTTRTGSRFSCKVFFPFDPKCSLREHCCYGNSGVSAVTSIWRLVLLFRLCDVDSKLSSCCCQKPRPHLATWSYPGLVSRHLGARHRPSNLAPSISSVAHASGDSSITPTPQPAARSMCAEPAGRAESSSLRRVSLPVCSA